MNLKQWETNGAIRKILTLNWVDVDVLLVNTVRNTVFIKGNLRFKGRLVPIDDESAVAVKLQEVEEAALGVAGLEHVRWELDGWEKAEGKWTKKEKIKD